MDINIDLLGFGYEKNAVYAVNPWKSRGRIYPEEKSLTRSEFQRDRDRIIHTTAFRRLKHKTQVFFPQAQDGDHYRTRLVHTVEVSQIARSLARALKLNEDLSESVALVHDFGHPPFGHTGEEVLHDLLESYGGFDHNVQSFRIVTKLERSYADFDGINLTWETLEGLIKHNGPFLNPKGEEINKSIPKVFLEYCQNYDLQLFTFPSLEAQVASIADDIAYNAHDVNDSLRSGLLTFEMLEEVPFLNQQVFELRKRYPNLNKERLAHEIMRRQITAMIEDVIAMAQYRLAILKPQSADDVRFADNSIIGFSEKMSEIDKKIKKMLSTKIYYHPNIMKIRENAAQVIRDLFNVYMDDWRKMHTRSQIQDNSNVSEFTKVRFVGDYLAGMTDTYAVEAHRCLFENTPDLF
ncbi:Deoxyguanosinetriphosphate triphosphohydrolase [Liberibacter crescens BT-1]|uniref:Deoxyguanosinetriphosphate triphosphohydrolase-like protein n=1 Tax=Liberibacter crescens (strain BT-1) TaxID=1215343 RepID=L0EX54_LIBCB|nr:deoxyguanosinetriphosphate triphosphohydrolase [Liberibacter crescens]AGA64956.1 Deoxyguanosinetriphosphate triphosphohydrolase [Liberibacter crescens BT-1]AMC12977.1 deoxyguanosinetriphosphate triphosphohydrolase [Liberibacter crescens]